MFDQENLENHFRKLAERHETPYNPADWEDMQARLMQIEPISPLRNPLIRVLKRSFMALALVFLTGIKVFYDTPLPAHVGKVNIYAKKESPTKQISQVTNTNSTTQNTPTTIEQKITNRLAQNTVNQSPSNQSTFNLPARATHESQEIVPSLSNNQLVIIPEEVLSLNEATIDSLAKQYNHIQPLLPLGFVALEPFMQKELTESNIPELTSVLPQNKADKAGKSRYQHLELFASESLHTNIALKVGSESLYNIFTVGYQFSGGGRWGFGYGFGKELRKQARGSLNLELLGYYIKENAATTPLNLLAQAKLQVNRKFTSRLTGFVGISGNVLLSDYRGEDLVTSAGIPRWMVAHTFLGSTSVKLWTGINLGVNLRLQK